MRAGIDEAVLSRHASFRNPYPPDEIAEEIVAVPDRAELQRAPDRDHPIHSGPAANPGQAADLLGI